MQTFRDLVNCTALLLLLFALLASPNAYAENVLIVNSNNTYSASEPEMREVVKRLFLKKQSTWPNGLNAKCFDRSKAGDEQSAFSKAILNMEKAAIARHWLSLKQATGESPPRNVASTNILTKFVGKYEGGMGVIAESELSTLSLPDNVRILFRF